MNSVGRRWIRRLERCGPLLPLGVTGLLVLKGLHPGLPGFSCPLRALTGLPCPTCYLTRATAASLVGRFDDSLALHAFGPVLAAGLVIWSLQALRTGRLVPRVLRGRHLAGIGLLLLLYWAARMGLTYGAGLQAFPLP
ncbi:MULTISPECIES: DUF2752 domain-containing protein [unclassified Cyanobium]|uniref:DUF2752 domain-containing protein n=1 Tax=unclassified Cyanobium TaxID=2627006 RepID=UPI0020CE2A14|nr:MULTISPECIES: DUF2752 domain-containing protein [unclassified Cyanobium]MCP9858726.1 DUF2752 domain-containing protein [Cyanobium sp. Cruz-8H5]MCP9865891.1 DUF2752 domain-containing protein [Cyanobium sp. Cruz-8D1]